MRENLHIQKNADVPEVANQCRSQEVAICMSAYFGFTEEFERMFGFKT